MRRDNLAGTPQEAKDGETAPKDPNRDTGDGIRAA